MKHLLKSLAVFAAIISFVSCSDDDSSSANPNTTVTDVVNTVNQGTWRVTLFNEDGDIQTDHFTGYNFTFGSSNVLTASNGTNTYTGIWNVNNSSDDDDSTNDIDFIITFASPPNFVEISDDWDVLERTDSRIRLRDVSGGNGTTDLLTFEKN